MIPDSMHVLHTSNKLQDVFISVKDIIVVHLYYLFFAGVLTWNGKKFIGKLPKNDTQIGIHLSLLYMSTV